MMRLPVKNCDPTDFDYEQIDRMADEFIGAGFTYFDTGASHDWHFGRNDKIYSKCGTFFRNCQKGFLQRSS